MPKLSRRHIGLALLIFYLTIFFVQKPDLTVADIGRHITNGRVIMQEGLSSSVIKTNFYSQTQADFPTINHHWLYGVVAATIFEVGGFAGLTWLNITLFGLAVSLMLIITARYTTTRLAIASGLLALPLLTDRTEIRPEVASLFFLSLSALLLTNLMHQLTNRQSASPQSLYLPKPILFLAAIAIFWVNTHLFFILGLGLVGAFLLTALINKSSTKNWLLFTLLVCTTVSLLNPHGLNGLLQPFHIFEGYNYRVVENQSVWFLINIIPQPQHFYLLAILVLTAILLSLVIMKCKLKTSSKHCTQLTTHPLFPLFLAAIVLLLANLMIFRLLPFTGLLLIPTLALLSQSLPLSRWWQQLTHHHLLTMLTSLSLFTLSLLAIGSNLFIPRISQLGITPPPEQIKAVEFIKQLPGPIINNYDIGGYFIFALFPNQKVYVDNRPEAYSADFFPNQYIEPLENESAWEKLESTQNFQSIIFYRHDLTPWAQAFMINRVQDEAWVPVYVDRFIVALVKNEPQHQALIDAHQVPRSQFKVVNPKVADPTESP